jgi:Ca-activated chloride channel homolog
MFFNKKYATILGIFCIGSLICLSSQPGAEGTKQTGKTPAIKVQVDMVSLPVFVTANDGNYIKDLKKEDFQIFENGIPQEIAGFSAVEAPISVALTLDTSGSSESQLSRIKNETRRFINLLRPDDSVALISFSDEVTLLEPFNIYHKKNPDTVRLLKSGVLSAVYEAVWLSLEQVLKLEFGRKALILLSDGIDTCSRTVTWQETIELAKTTDSVIYCIYFQPYKYANQRSSSDAHPMEIPTNQTLVASQFPPFPIPRRGSKHPEDKAGKEYLMDLAKHSGGLFVDASKLDNLGSAFRRITEELWSQYSIGYYPKNLKHDKSFREITIKVKRPNLAVRSKLGYYDF